MNPVRALAQKCIMPSGKVRRGAMSRFAERLGVSHSTIRNWIFGDQYGRVWLPSKARLAQIEDALRENIDLSPRKSGPSKARANGVKRNSQLRKNFGDSSEAAK